MSIVTLIYFANIQYIDVASHDQHLWHTVFDFLVKTTSFKLHNRECLGEPGFEEKPQNSGVSGTGEPPLGWAWTRSSACALYLSLFEWMPKREMLDQWEGNGRQVQVTLLFKKGYILDCCICSLWRLTKCSVCRFAGMMTSMIWQRGGGEWNGQTPSRLAKVGSPLSSAVRPQLTMTSRSTKPHSPVPCLLRPFWKGSPPGQVPWGSPRVPWLRNTALVAAVARKAETTKYGPWVTQAQNRTRAAPGPRGADGVTTTRKQQEHSWESYDALAANWTMRRQREPHWWGLGTSQLGLEGPQWWHGVMLAHGYMKLQWSRLPLRKQNGKHTHCPGC